MVTYLHKFVWPIFLFCLLSPRLLLLSVALVPNMAAAAATATASSAAATAPAQPPPIPEECKYKNRLQEFAQRTHKELPTYHTEAEGQQHQLKFRSTVHVGGEQFSSSHSFNRRKEAEQDAAKVAYEVLMRREKQDGGVAGVLPLIDQDVVFCKSILHEFSVKTKTERPSYSVVKPEGPYILFVGSVLFGGTTYTGEAATNKKDAEQKAARAAIKSILATEHICMLEIIRAKKKLITAITSSGYNKERGAVVQEIHHNPTNNLPPIAAINFTPAIAYTAYGAPPGALVQPPPQAQILNYEGKPLPPLPQVGTTAAMSGLSEPLSSNAVQGHNMFTAADSSVQPVVGSAKKRKKNRSGGPQAKEARAA